MRETSILDNKPTGDDYTLHMGGLKPKNQMTSQVLVRYGSRGRIVQNGEIGL